MLSVAFYTLLGIFCGLYIKNSGEKKRIIKVFDKEDVPVNGKKELTAVVTFEEGRIESWEYKSKTENKE